MEGFSKDTKIVIGMVGLPARGKVNHTILIFLKFSI